MWVGRILMLGCGNMGGAMLRGWIANGLNPSNVTVVDPANPVLPDGVTCLDQLAPNAEAPSLCVLAIKPQMLEEVAPRLNAAIGSGTILLSILAGIESQALAKALPNAGQFVRAMPNTPASVGRGITAAFAPDGDSDLRAKIAPLLTALGALEWVEDEALFHAVTALSGSGPAFVFRFIDALAASGAQLGLPADQAKRLALATVEGSAALAAQSDESLMDLARRVTSPNGTTAAGLEELDADGLFASLIRATLTAAAKRSRELGSGPQR